VFDHVGIRASDQAASEQFYETLLASLGIAKSHDGRYVEWEDFSVASADEEAPTTRGLHIGFAARSRADVDGFWRVGIQARYRDDGPPGPRPHYGPDYYGAFLLDPDGNSAEAVHHGETGDRATIDHVWVRVESVAASKRFYDLIAEETGFRLEHDSPERAQFVGPRSTFSVVQGDPTEHVHIAFPAPDDATVESFHRRATGAGYADNGGPGERPEYHPGYFGAYVLDPDGNNIEVVHHGRD
jgi:catechol 2,3-dioxygenase-like lactoylglutathione lyase family enzyme